MKEPHEIEWSPDQVTRFWNWMAEQPAMQEVYFSRMRGDAILGAVNRHVILKNKTILDLGSGPGYLTDKLLARGARVIAADTSAESVAALQRRLNSQPNFLGAHTSTSTSVPLASEMFDVIFSIETIEHLDDRVLTSLLNEAHRMLKLAGKVVITTPNDEDLAREKVLCPNCGSVFHTMQHQRSWTAATLKQRMLEHNFQTVRCEATVFSLLPPLLRPLNRLALAANQMKMPHLLYIGKKV